MLSSGIRVRVGMERGGGGEYDFWGATAVPHFQPRCCRGSQPSPFPRPGGQSMTTRNTRPLINGGGLFPSPPLIGRGLWSLGPLLLSER